jgi:NADH-quinone oxidoreductase subunit C
MEREALLQKVTALADGITVVPSLNEAPTQLPEILIPLAKFRGVMETLHNDKALSFDFPMSMTAVDWPEEKKITCVYHLYSMDQKHKLVVKVDADREKPVVPTVSDLWRGCEWFEREVYDMFGVVFDGHPDLRRILMTDDWVGFPLRKDYKDSRIAGKPY